MNGNVSVILVAGGSGTRMKMATPKQFLILNDKVIINYSLDLFMEIDDVKEIIVVCAQEYRHLVKAQFPRKPIKFAAPGIRRQDSVYNGFKHMDPQNGLACIHDSARPLVSKEMIEKVIHAGASFGAATAAVPLKFTIKETDESQLVVQTPDRSKLWEIQTPQTVRHELLIKGFEYANRHNLTVTDDVSLVEHLGLPVKLVEGCYKNLKITTPEDLQTAEQLFKKSYV
jgi:2-C-methyl-D-erythritol 4-phosphate cytidylyltransferase